MEAKITGEVYGLSKINKKEHKLWDADKSKKERYDTLIKRLITNSMIPEEDIIRVDKDNIASPNILKGDQTSKKVVE